MKRSQRWVTLPPLRPAYRVTPRGVRVLRVVRGIVTTVTCSMALVGLVFVLLAWFMNLNEVPVP